MSETRRQVLEMLAAGKITAEEAERLIAAFERDSTPAAETRPATKAKYLRVMVDSDEPGKGPVRVNTRVPMQCCGRGKTGKPDLLHRRGRRWIRRFMSRGFLST